MSDSPLQRFLRSRGAVFEEVTPGVLTPAYFQDPVTEHLATRHSVGLFDFSFMGCMEIAGNDVHAFLHRLQTRSLTRLANGRLFYTLLLRPDGSVLNDATLWQLDPDRYWLFVGRRADLDHVATLARDYSVTLSERSAQQVVLAVQGTRAETVLRKCLSGVPQTLPYYAFATAHFEKAPCLIARIGYSGEPGYELIVEANHGTALWRALLEAGEADALTECGFVAADSLRIEAGHILFSRELAAPVTPHELGFARLVDFHGTTAIGVPALRARRWQEPCQRLVGLVIDSARVAAARANTQAPVAGTARLTSACHSPILGRTIGLGFVNPADRYPGTRVRLIGGERARVARLPFYDPGRFLARWMS